MIFLKNKYLYVHKFYTSFSTYFGEKLSHGLGIKKNWF